MTQLQRLALISFLLAPLPAAAQAVRPDERVPVAVTAGEGIVRAVPDRAFVTITAESRASNPRDTQRRNIEQMKPVLDKLRAAGIPEEAIRTAAYELHREYEWERERRVAKGYVARNSVEVQLHDLAKVGPAIDAALARGANTINSLQFESSKADSARREALAVAVRQARADADAMAVAAGRCIVDVIELSTTEMVQPFMRMERAAVGMAQDVASTPIEPGEQTISVTVQGRWQLQSAGRVCQQ